MVIATLKNGNRVQLKTEAGETAKDVIEHLHEHTLTGSAAPLADVWVSAEKGGMIRFDVITMLEDVDEPGALTPGDRAEQALRDEWTKPR